MFGRGLDLAFDVGREHMRISRKVVYGIVCLFGMDANNIVLDKKIELQA